MSEIIVPEGYSSEEEDVQEIKINYNATEEDEEKFQLLYHLNIQPSEIDFDLTDVERRRWVFARFMAQKKMEQEMMMEHRRAAAIAQGIDPSKLRV